MSVERTKQLKEALAASKRTREPAPTVQVVETVSENAQESTMPLSKIRERQAGDTRPLNQSHVEELAESIAVLGLIEPLVVDKNGHLLAGGHRKAAIAYLKENEPDKYSEHFSSDQIPVRVMPFDSEADLDLAVAIEIAENERRRDYTADEVKKLARRLEDAGYIRKKGGIQKGQKSLIPALSAAVGKHRRTIERYLRETDTTNVASVEIDDRHKLLKQALPKLQKWQEVEPQTKQEENLAKKLPDIIKLIEKIVEGN